MDVNWTAVIILQCVYTDAGPWQASATAAASHVSSTLTKKLKSFKVTQLIGGRARISTHSLTTS